MGEECEQTLTHTHIANQHMKKQSSVSLLLVKEMHVKTTI